ncbi:unnamed protein product, partial [Mesorhabditis belari]|uniref:Uncharacterized protein n=1 Tax=Mesorhabditis belari TaxID=2138241 RepID=A0AAF3FLG1_9BILA
MRTQSQLIPSTITEKVVNPDGSVTTRLKSSHSMSSQWSRQETYINGVKQMSKSRFRAFVEYKGPDGGFKVKLSDEGEEDLSEEENDEDEHSTSTWAQMAAKELVDSEQRYVDKLRLLDQMFRLEVEAMEKAGDIEKGKERYRKVIEMQELLGNSLPLVSVGREFIEMGPIQKINSGTHKPEERYLFLFNDLVLLGVKGIVSKYRVRARFEALHTRICEGDNLEREHSFYLRGSYGSEPQRCVELFADSRDVKEKWMRKLQEVITKSRDNSASFSKHGSKRSSISETKSNNSKYCAECDAELGFMKKLFKSKCSKCNRKLCDKCLGRYKSDGKKGKICEACVKNTLNSDTLRNAAAMMRGDVLDKPPKGDGVLHGSEVRFKHNRAVSMLPLPGAEVKMCGEKWMAVLDLAANAQLSQSDTE